MRIVILGKPEHNLPEPQSGAIVEGKTYLELVQRLNAFSPFLQCQTEEQYMERILDDLQLELKLEDEGEIKARKFIRSLASRGLVAFCMDLGSGEIPDRLWEAILLIRDTGATNMFDYPVVAGLMKECGYVPEGDWVLANAAKYVELIFGNALGAKDKAECAGK